MNDKGGLTQLIEALSILVKYEDPAFPTHCEHDEFHVYVDPSLVSDEDKAKLEELGFVVSGEYGTEHFLSFYFGSC